MDALLVANLISQDRPVLEYSLNLSLLERFKQFAAYKSLRIVVVSIEILRAGANRQCTWICRNYVFLADDPKFGVEF